jgi:hypothetical protein
MFAQTSKSNGLSLFAKSQYNVDRQMGQIAQGIARLISSPAAPLYNILPGDITIGTQGPASNQKLYTNITGGVLAPNGTLDLTFRAATIGSAYNISNVTPLDLKTSLAGVTVSNPIYPPAATWITLAGSDEESDEALLARCLARWSTIGAECNIEAMTYFALLAPPGYTASPVKFLRVMRNWIVGPPYTGYWPGGITIIVANDGGGLSPTDLAAVRSNFENPQKYGIGRKLNVINAENVSLAVQADIYVFKSAGVSNADIISQSLASLADFQSFLQIGEVVFPEKVGARIEDGNKVAIRNVNVLLPANPLIPQFFQRVILGPITLNVIGV